MFQSQLNGFLQFDLELLYMQCYIIVGFGYNFDPVNGVTLDFCQVGKYLTSLLYLTYMVQGSDYCFDIKIIISKTQLSISPKAPYLCIEFKSSLVVAALAVSEGSSSTCCAGRSLTDAAQTDLARRTSEKYYSQKAISRRY